MSFIGHAGPPHVSSADDRELPRPQPGAYGLPEWESRSKLRENAAGQFQPAADRLELYKDLLEAVCAKLVIKIKELDRTAGDLRNLIKVSAIPAIFVDENLLVREFTPAMKKVCALSPQDIGRSLLEFACRLNYCCLEDDFRRLAETGETVERYLEGRQGKVHYSVRMMPNFCRDNAIGGATVTFAEIATYHSGRA